MLPPLLFLSFSSSPASVFSPPQVFCSSSMSSVSSLDNCLLFCPVVILWCTVLTELHPACLLTKRVISWCYSKMRIHVPGEEEAFGTHSLSRITVQPPHSKTKLEKEICGPGRIPNIKPKLNMNQKPWDVLIRLFRISISLDLTIFTQRLYPVFPNFLKYSPARCWAR